MRNLFQFIWKYHFTFLFIILEVVAVLLLSTNNSYQRTRMHSLSLAISGVVYDWQENITRYINLAYENEVLRRQNALLKTELYKAYGSDSIPKSRLGIFRVQPTTVINSSYNRGNNYVIINAGRKDGVEEEMGVRGPEGVVGIVTHVSDHYAAVMPVIHSQSQLSCQLAKNNYFGLMRWDGRDHRVGLLEDIPNHVQIDSGDAIITRGSSGIFPKGLPVGHAVATEKNPSTGFQTIYVALATNFEHLNTAYVIQSQLKNELDSLSGEIIKPEEE